MTDALPSLIDDLYILMGPRGRMVTQRTANPCIPVRFRARPPVNLIDNSQNLK
nr:hypothetical protein BAR15_130112 [Bartonella sp. AR 15-3]